MSEPTLIELAEQATQALAVGQYGEGLTSARAVITRSPAILAADHAPLFDLIVPLEKLLQATVGAGEALLASEVERLDAEHRTWPSDPRVRHGLQVATRDLHRVLEPAYEALTHAEAGR